MRIKDPIAEAEEPFNLVPLTDIVFNLLIFFMAATTFAQVERELGVQLPKATSFGALSAVPQQLVINIDEGGTPIVRRVPYALGDLSRLIAETSSRSSRLTVVIRADRRGRVQALDDVLDVCKRAGVNEVSISYLSGGTGSTSGSNGGGGGGGGGASP